MKQAVPLLLMLALASCGLFRGDGDRRRTPTVGERLPVLAFEAQLEADPELATTQVTLPPPEPNAAWPQPGGGPTKSLGHVALAPNPSQAFVVEAGQGSSRTRRLNAAPVVADGRIYVIDTSATVRAFSTQNGAPLWSASIAREDEGDAIAFGGGVSAGGGRVYATSGYGIAAAFDAATGAPVWRVELGAPLRGAPTVAGDRVYFLSQDNQLFVLDAATGERLWDVAGTIEEAGLLGAAAPAVANDTVVVGFSSGELTALLAANGRTVWQDALARTGRTTALGALTDIDAPPVIDRDRVFAIGHGGRMVTLELSTGQRVWERNFAGVSMPWVAGDWIFAVNLDGQLAALTRGEGRVRWVTQLPRWRDEEDKEGRIRWFGPVLAGGQLYLTGSDGRLQAVSPLTGELGRSWRIDGPLYTPPVVAGGQLYVLNDEARLLAFR